jgi:hypothetical protein
MNRNVLIVIGVLIALGLGWFALMGFLNSRSSNLNVAVSGAVDEVILYEAGQPETEVARIVTNGEDIRQSIRLRNTADYSFWRQMPPAQYHFIARQGDQTGRHGPVCCPVGLRPATINLVIRSVDSWERSSE